MALIKPGGPGDSSAARLAEQRIREWSLNLESERWRREESPSEQVPDQIHPYVAMSREAGAGGGMIARRVGQLLGWEVLHRELLDQIAEKYQLPREKLSSVDEKTSNWMIEVFGKWLNPRIITPSEYMLHLGQIVLLAAQHSSAVFVGRGAQFLLPSTKGLSVYVVAPIEMRIGHICQLRDCSEADARRYIRDTDRGRHDLIKGHFNREIGDPHLYDLVINREHLDCESAADLVAAACRKRFAEA